MVFNLSHVTILVKFKLVFLAAILNPIFPGIWLSIVYHVYGIMYMVHNNFKIPVGKLFSQGGTIPPYAPTEDCFTLCMRLSVTKIVIKEQILVDTGS